VSIPEVQSRSRLLAFLKNFFAEKSSTSKAAPTDASYLTLGTNGDLSAERVLTAGDNITFTDGGAGGTLTIDASGGGGGGDVSVSGTPANNEIPTWTDSTTIKGEDNLTFDGTTLAVAGNETIITSNTGLTNDRALLVQNTADNCNIEVDAATSYEANVIFSENGTEKWIIGNREANDNLRIRNAEFTDTVLELTQGGSLGLSGGIEIDGDITVNGGDVYSVSSTGGFLLLKRHDATITTGETLGSILFQATENGTDASLGAEIRAVATENFVYPSNEGTKLEFLTTANGAGLYNVNMTLHDDGVLQVGSLKGNTDTNLTIFSDHSMYFDIDEDNDGSAGFYWRNGANTTVMFLDESGNLQMDGDLTVDGGDIYSIDSAGGDLFLRRNDSNIVADEVLGNIFFQATEDGSNVSFGAAIRGVATETFVYPTAEGTKLEFMTTPNGSGYYGVKMTLDGDGNLGIGTSSPTYLLEAATDTTNEGVVGVTQYNNTLAGDGADVNLSRARGTMAAPTVVQSGDQLGSLRFKGYDGSDFTDSARIQVVVDNTPGSMDMPARMVFETAADGSSVFKERLRLDSTGMVYIGDATDIAASPRGDLTVYGGAIHLGSHTSLIKDKGDFDRIVIVSGSHVSLCSPDGNAEFVVYETYCKTMSDLRVGGNIVCLSDTDTMITLGTANIAMFAGAKARIEMDGNGIGMFGETPGADTLSVGGDIETTGDLTIDGDTTATGQITTGYDPGVIAQQILDPSSVDLDALTNDTDNLWRVEWSVGSTTDPQVTFTAPANGKVMVHVTAYLDTTANTYFYAALSSSGDSKIGKTDSSVVGSEKLIWIPGSPSSTATGARDFHFYADGLTGGASYTWYLFMRITTAVTARILCGGSWPPMEMTVRPVYSAADIYTT